MMVYPLELCCSEGSSVDGSRCVVVGRDIGAVELFISLCFQLASETGRSVFEIKLGYLCVRGKKYMMCLIWDGVGG